MSIGAFHEAYVENFINSKIRFDALSSFNGEVQTLSWYRKVFEVAELYLKNTFSHIYSPLQSKSAVDKEWTPKMTAHFLLGCYALRLQRSPWNSALHQIKTYSGYFQHLLLSCLPLPEIERILDRMSYSYSEQEQHFTLQPVANSALARQELLVVAGMDCFLAHVHHALVDLDCRVLNGHVTLGEEPEILIDFTSDDDQHRIEPTPAKPRWAEATPAKIEKTSSKVLAGGERTSSKVPAVKQVATGDGKRVMAGRGWGWEPRVTLEPKYPPTATEPAHHHHHLGQGDSPGVQLHHWLNRPTPSNQRISNREEVPAWSNMPSGGGSWTEKKPYSYDVVSSGMFKDQQQQPALTKSRKSYSEALRGGDSRIEVASERWEDEEGSPAARPSSARRRSAALFRSKRDPGDGEQAYPELFDTL